MWQKMYKAIGKKKLLAFIFFIYCLINKYIVKVKICLAFPIHN